MGSDRTQPTPVDSNEYEQFRQFVQDVHGSVRGNLRTELENAMRQYRESYYGEDRLLRIEDDLATIKSMVAEAESDGGTTASEADETQTHRTAPHAKASVAKKVEWLVAQYDEWDIVDVDDMREDVEDTYGYADPERGEKLVQRALKKLDVVEHPHNENSEIYVTPERRDEIIERRKEELKEDAEKELEDL